MLTEEDLTLLVRAARRAEAARIDANACQTQRDRDAAREAEEQLWDLKERLVAQLGRP